MIPSISWYASRCTDQSKVLYKLPIELATAGVSPDRPLQVGREATHNLGDKAGGSGYGFALFGGKIILCRGKPARPIRMHY